MQPVLQEIQTHSPNGDESRRLFHGRGCCFPGYDDLVIDWFKPVVLITLYRSRGTVWLEKLIRLLRQQLVGVRAILLQERFISHGPSRLLWGDLPETVDAVEDGLHYRLRLADAQNIGFFLDMAVGRRLVRERGANRRVLNLFAYTCSFSVAALTGGAEQVVNLDMNRGALELGRFNHRLNRLEERRATFLTLELLRSFSKLRKLAPFDLLICDPPASQGKSFNAERDWPKLLRRFPGLLAPGAEILACLNAHFLPPEFLQQLFSTLMPQAELLQALQPGGDFPESSPEKGLWILHYRIP